MAPGIRTRARIGPVSRRRSASRRATARRRGPRARGDVVQVERADDALRLDRRRRGRSTPSIVASTSAEIGELVAGREAERQRAVGDGVGGVGAERLVVVAHRGEQRARVARRGCGWVGGCRTTASPGNGVTSMAATTSTTGRRRSMPTSGMVSRAGQVLDVDPDVERPGAAGVVPPTRALRRDHAVAVDELDLGDVGDPNDGLEVATPAGHAEVEGLVAHRGVGQRRRRGEVGGPQVERAGRQRRRGRSCPRCRRALLGRYCRLQVWNWKRSTLEPVTSRPRRRRPDVSTASSRMLT